MWFLEAKRKDRGASEIQAGGAGVKAEMSLFNPKPRWELTSVRDPETRRRRDRAATRERE